MAVVPGKSIFESQKLKPSTFVVWCLLCDVKNENLEDVYLEQEKAAKAGIMHSAYYAAFNELESKEWIQFSRKADGKKWWKLVKGFENKEDSANVENSINAENEGENLSANVEFSANAEKSVEQNSANADSHIRNIVPSEELQDSYESFSERERTHEPISENEFLKIYKEFYPAYQISIHQQETIETRIRDGTAWRKALMFWATNHYRPQSVGKICDKYDEILAEQKYGSNSNRNGKPSKSAEWQQTVDEYAQLYASLDAESRAAENSN